MNKFAIGGVILVSGFILGAPMLFKDESPPRFEMECIKSHSALTSVGPYGYAMVCEQRVQVCKVGKDYKGANLCETRF